MVRAYWKRVRREAWADTVATLRLNSLAGFVMWVFATLGVLIGLLFWGSADAPRDELVTRIFLGMVAVGAIPFIFAWKFVGTPARLDNNIRNWARDLEKVIIDTRNGDAAIAGIIDRYRVGLEIMKSENWHARMKAWETEFDAHVKQHFKPGYWHRLCFVERSNQTAINRDPMEELKSYYLQKLTNIGRSASYAETYYRGDLGKIDEQYGAIRGYGLPEHRLPQGTAT